MYILKHLLWSSPWPLITDAFCEQPFADWIVAILRPHLKLAIPIQELHKFQLYAAITLDHIWFSRNQLVHQAITPSPSRSLIQITSDFAVATTVVSDSNDNIIGVATKKIFTKDVALGEAQAALLAVHTAAFCGVYSLILEGDALNVVLAIQQTQLFEG